MGKQLSNTWFLTIVNPPKKYATSPYGSGIDIFGVNIYNSIQN